MLFPLATVVLSLAATGLKVYGGDGALVTLFQHPLDLLAGHRAAGEFERLANRFRKWSAGNRSPDNEDLERAITRSAILADLLCLSGSLPTKLVGIELVQRLRERFDRLLPESSAQGMFQQ